MWIPFDNKEVNKPESLTNRVFTDANFPPEGVDVMVTDGKQIAVMWYICSSIYDWFFDNPNDPDDALSGDEIPFQPTHWMYIEDYKVYIQQIRDDKLKLLEIE